MTSISHFFDGEFLSELFDWLSLELSRIGRGRQKGGNESRLIVTTYSETPGDAAEHEDVIMVSHIRDTDEFAEPSPAVNRAPT